ncbi:MAG: SGNH/GDSL hydrolase family protein [Lewinellaceae bacterium]|nr:SGNH/GDSL hydrolase family protein [Saprospiraceae bacterium]MCB9315290.1 SGNH/GDSL hydrolase family protein [Lewinellaceae bacterium]MCB9334419.1 SGNH/GDSL hydrolase family protein [Lewinellaceae bacterium]
MKYTLLLLVLGCFLCFSAWRQKRTRLVFFGDSITEVGVKPGGYISQLRDSLPAAEYELLGAGISGNKVYDLYLRLEDDVLAKQPDQVFIFVGVNDVWHKRLLGTGTDADKFRRFYTALIQKMQARNIRLVLCTPACIGEKTDYTNPLDGDLNLYAQIIRELAAVHGCGLCDLRKVFLDYNLKYNTGNLEKGVLTTDGVHLNKAGNTLVAEQMLGFIRE